MCLPTIESNVFVIASTQDDNNNKIMVKEWREEKSDGAKRKTKVKKEWQCQV